MFDPAQAVRFQGNFQTMIESSMGRGRESYDKAAEYAKENMKTIEQVVVAAQGSSKLIGEKESAWDIDIKASVLDGTPRNIRVGTLTVRACVWNGVDCLSIS